MRQGGRDEQAAGHLECRGGGGGVGGNWSSGTADGHRRAGARVPWGFLSEKPLWRMASTKSSSGTKSPRRSFFQFLEPEDRSDDLAERPCLRIASLKEIQSGRVTLDVARASYAARAEGQKGLWASRVGVSGSRGAGLASSTRGLTMWMGAHTRQWSDHRVGTATGRPAVQIL